MDQPKSPKMTFNRANSLLLVLIILVNGYIIAAPFFPAVVFWWDNRGGTHQQKLTSQIHETTQVQSTSPAAANQANQLVIPSMLLDQNVLEGPIRDTYKTLAQGVWRWPKGSTPDKGSNTVLIGHRFTYTQPKGVFYYLNKVKVGDEIGMTWNNKKYVYKVSTINEVSPSQTGIQDPTPDARLTIFTCTPLWNPVHRLVIVAELETE